MKLYQDVNLLENEALIKQINKWSLWLLLFSMPVFVFIAYVFFDLFQQKLQISDVFLTSVSLFLVIIVHEGIHGLFFKLFKPQAKVTFGFKSGMAYAASLGNRYTRKQALWILLAPFVFLTFFFALLTYLNLISAIVFVVLGVVHTGACIGDFYYSYLLVNTPGKVIMEDTEMGIKIFQVD